jgi:TATA-binding protein-associated factor
MLAQLRPLLRSRKWETRIAAGVAIGAVAACVPPWVVASAAPGHSAGDGGGGGGGGAVAAAVTAQPGYLSFQTFDVDSLADHGEELLASSGAEYDVDWGGMDEQQRLRLQHKNLRKKLGLNKGEESAGSLHGMITDEDLRVQPNSKEASGSSKRKAVDIIEGVEQGEQLSVREKNRAKRMSRQRVVDQSSAAQTPLSMKQPPTNTAEQSAQAEPEPWPFHTLCLVLRADLLDVSWHVRHGAAVGLRALALAHAACLGAPREAPPGEQMRQIHAFGEDLALRICCVIALDRFGDYASTSVVAPVRETCAQLLSILAQRMRDATVLGLVSTLTRMQSRKQWHIRHASFIALRYISSVRIDLLARLTTVLLPPTVEGLSDVDSEVRGAAADVLSPLCAQLAHVESTVTQLSSARARCWKTLLCDDVGVTAKATMKLLAALYTSTCTGHISDAVVCCDEVRRLFTFVFHSSDEVRAPAMKTLCVLVRNACSQAPTPQWFTAIYADVLAISFAVLLMETNSVVVSSTLTIWQECICALADENLLVFIPQLVPWLQIVAMDSGHVAADHLATAAFGSCAAVIPQSITMHSAVDTASSCRLRCCRALGRLVSAWPAASCRPALSNAVTTLGQSTKGYERQCAALLVASVVPGLHTAVCDLVSTDAVSTLQRMVFSPRDDSGVENCYNELKTLEQAMQKQYIELKHRLESTASQIQFDGQFAALIDSHGEDITAAALALCTTVFDQVFERYTSHHPASAVHDAQKTQHTLLSHRETCAATIGYLATERARINNVVMSAGAMALVAMQRIPAKVSPVIKVLIGLAKRETCEAAQKNAGYHLVKLMRWCNENRKSKVVARIIQNICALLGEGSVSNIGLCLPESVPPTIDEDKALDELYRNVACRGAKFVFECLCDEFGASLFDNMPTLHTLTASVRAHEEGSSVATSIALDTVSDGGSLPVYTQLQGLRVCTAIYPHLHDSLRTYILSLLPSIVDCIRQGQSPMLTSICDCLSIMASTSTLQVMEFIVQNGVPMLGNADSNTRIGAVHVLHKLVLTLGMQILPFVVCMVVPMLGAMSDPNDRVRSVGSTCFALLMNLLPLASGISIDPDMSGWMLKMREKDERFVGQLLGEQELDTFSLPLYTQTTMRSYQRHGVNWLAFLNKSKLHGILCDEVNYTCCQPLICMTKVTDDCAAV